jgi:F-type H+-transporting ATPase subunit a
MEEQISVLVRLVNHWLGGTAMALLHVFHLNPKNPELPIPQQVVMGTIVVIVGTILALVVRSRLSVERPGAFQQVAEILVTNPMDFGIRDLLRDNMGRAGDRYIPWVGSIAIFVLLGNLMGAFPNTIFAAPTGHVTVPLACAILTFLHFNWQGIRHHGAGHYLLTFAGSPKHPADWALAILLFPVEIVSTLARLLSLTVRLWANMFASDLIYSVFLGLLVSLMSFGWHKFAPLGAILSTLAVAVPVAFLGLHIFVSVVQAYIFTVLPAVYLGLATADEH